MTLARRLLVALLLVAVALGGLGAQDDDDPDTRLNDQFVKIEAAIRSDDVDQALRDYEPLWKLIEATSYWPETKRDIEARARVRVAGLLVSKGKKAEAAASLVRAFEVGWWRWDELEQDEALEALRADQELWKKTIETGKELEKKAPEACADEARRALAAPPLFELDLTVKTLDGKELELSALRGKVVVIDFWGTWCPPCVEELPNLEKLHETWAEKGVVLVGLACEYGDVAQAAPRVRAMAARYGLKYPIAVLPKKDALVEKHVGRYFPTKVLLDREGKVRIKRTNLGHYASLEGYVRGLLEAKVPEKK